MNEGLKDIAANDEIRIAFDCINLGIQHIAAWKAQHNEYFVPLLLLSTGYERLLKILLCLEYFDKNGSYPTIDYFKQHIGKIHNIEVLLTKILATVQNTVLYNTAPARKADVELLQNDEDLQWIISLLNDFANNTRYHNINTIIENPKSAQDPWESISQFRTQYYTTHYQSQNEELLKDLTPFYRDVHGYLIGILQRFTRVLCFCFTQGAFGNKARQVSAGLLDNFLSLKDGEIGDISKLNS